MAWTLKINSKAVKEFQKILNNKSVGYSKDYNDISSEFK
jgi:hypothetical protein